MDLAFHGRRDLASAFVRAYFLESGDEEGKELLPLYTAYRASVRGLVDGLKLEEKEVPEVERRLALGSARAHWLLALGEVEEPGRRPCLLLVGGLPGTGKSTLAGTLAEQLAFRLVRSDEVRKELAGLPADARTPVPMREELYSPAWNTRTYAECLRRAEAVLQEGGRVLVDANFREESQRKAFLEAATRWGAPGLIILCRAAPEVIRTRLDHRRGDASDADWEVYRMTAGRWEEPAETRPAVREIATDGDRQEALRRALEVIREAELG
jgi:predicted kinase